MGRTHQKKGKQK